LTETVPPKLYGGTERVVSFLTEALVEMGHDVTLFASGDSVTSAKLVPCCPRALRFDPQCKDPLAWHVIEVEAVARLAESFDIIHYHVDYLHFPVSTRLRTPHVTTLHGRLDLPELPMVHRMFPGVPLISISDAQRTPLPDLNWRATIYHGLPGDWAYGQNGSEPEHLTFLGRISPEKRVDQAIEIAIRSQQRLVIAAKIDKLDQDYFSETIKPLLDHPLVHFIGEVDDDEKKALLRNTTALLFPIDWPEPFGIVLIEAMACGVPVIAFPAGSVPEIIESGVTGFLVNGVEEAVEALERIREINRDRCRAEFARRFRSTRMAADYVAEYKRLIQGQDSHPSDLLSVA
jgi:glycosyltransferase involved in cell wall biosynthesis